MDNRCPMRAASGKAQCEKALICEQSNSESAGFAVNGYSMSIFHPMDAEAMTFVDEDSFAAGRYWQLTRTASIKTLSDKRLKSNIASYQTDNILEKIMDIKVVSYKFNYSHESNSTDGDISKKIDRQEIGILAQSSERNFPTAVSKKTKVEDTLFVDYAALNIHLVEALQRLRIQNEKLDSRIHNAQDKFKKLQALLMT